MLFLNFIDLLPVYTSNTKNNFRTFFQFQGHLFYLYYMIFVPPLYPLFCGYFPLYFSSLHFDFISFFCWAFVLGYKRWFNVCYLLTVAFKFLKIIKIIAFGKNNKRILLCILTIATINYTLNINTQHFVWIMLK